MSTTPNRSVPSRHLTTSPLPHHPSAAMAAPRQRQQHHGVSLDRSNNTPSSSAPPSSSLVGPSHLLLHETTILTAVNKGLTSMRSILHLEEMVRLETLNLHMNLLTTLDRGLMASPSMRHVVDFDVSGNDLESLDGIQHLVHLKRLNVASNRIHNIAAVFRPLQELEWLNLSFNLLEDLLGVRELPGESLQFVDVSGNLVRRWESLDALSHCGHLRELRVTIARAYFPGHHHQPASTPPAASSKVTATSPARASASHHSASHVPVAASLPGRDFVDEASLQLLDNPLVGTPGYQDSIRMLLPQLVLLDGVRVGFDPLQDPSSFGYIAPPATSSSLWHAGGTPPPRPSTLSVQALEWHQQSHKRSDHAMDGGASSPGQMGQLTPHSGASGGGGGVRTKRVSRSSQTDEPRPLVTTPLVTLRSVAVETTLLGSFNDNAPLLQDLERRNSDLASAAQQERSEHRSKVLKLQQLLASVSAERDDARAANKELESSAAVELNHHLQSHAHTVAQITALKEELHRSASDAERHEQIALKLQKDRLVSASRDHDEHKKQKWQQKLSALERDHRHALAALEQELTTRAAASHAALLDAKDTTIEALRGELRLMKESITLKSNAHDKVLSRQAEGALLDAEASERKVLALQGHTEWQELQWMVSSEVQSLRDKHFHREWDQLLAAYHAALRQSTKPQCADASTSTTRHVTQVAEVQTDPLPPPEPCNRCPALARRVVEIETISSALSQSSALDQARIAELGDLLQTVGRRHEDEMRAAREEADSQLRRTMHNLSSSLVAQEEAHKVEIQDINRECWEKINEKKAQIHNLQTSCDEWREKAAVLRKQLEEADAKLDAAAAAEVASHHSEDEERQQLREVNKRLSLHNQQLLEAVSTLRHQLIAVDSVNRALSARTEDVVAQLRSAERNVAHLQESAHVMEAARNAALHDQMRMKEQLKSLAA